jgi:hypothetical protein
VEVLRIDEKIIVQLMLKINIGRRRIAQFCFRYGSVATSSGHRTKLSGLPQGRHLLEKLSACYFLNQDSAAYSYLSATCFGS